MGFVYTVSQSNNNPRVIAMYYLEAIRRLGVAPRLLRCDTGTENSFSSPAVFSSTTTQIVCLVLKVLYMGKVFLIKE